MYFYFPKEFIDDWSQQLITLVTTLVSIAGLYSIYERNPEIITHRAAMVLYNSRADKVLELNQVRKSRAIMPRPCLALALKECLEQSAYSIVEGPRGSGKTTGVLHSLSGKAALLRVKLTNHDDTLDAIAKELGMPGRITMTMNLLEDVLRKTVAMGERPTIIAELSRDAKMLNEQFDVGVLKEVCVDKGLANVVIVLGDADAAFAMPEDHARQNNIWVNDFTEADAHIYLDKLGAPPAPPAPQPQPRHPRNELFYEAGTRPMHLLAAAEKGFNTFIALAQGEAEKKLDALLYMKGGEPGASAPGFTRLTIDLLENTSDGWSLQGFDKSAENLGLPHRSTLKYLASPQIVANVYKKNGHAVLYHQPSDTYRFHSTSHRRCAERKFPEAAARGAAKSRPRSTLLSCMSRVFG